MVEVFGSLEPATGAVLSENRLPGTQTPTQSFLDRPDFLVRPCAEIAPAAPRRAVPASDRSWAELLRDAIESDILPRLVELQRAAEECEVIEPTACQTTRFDIQAFVDLLISDDMEQAHAVADRVIVLSGGRDALLRDLLAPAAQHLGVLWEQDVCDFTTVTLGVYRLDQIMRHTAATVLEPEIVLSHERHALLLPAPGEQHSFGLNMVADIFRESGWCVRSGPAVPKAKLLDLVKGEWFDMVGFSVTADRSLKGLAACLRAIRKASCNAGLGIMIGGYAVAANEERTRFLGADFTSGSAEDALRQANRLVDARTLRSISVI